MLNRPHLGRVTVNPRDRVLYDSRVGPGALPELIRQLHVLVGARIPLVMGNLLVEAVRLGGAVEERGHDVPADAAAGEVVERRELARQGVRRRLVRGRRGDAEGERLGDGGHCRD